MKTRAESKKKHDKSKLWMVIGEIGDFFHHPVGKDYKWYISGIFPANWVIICYQSHLLREPGNSIDNWQEKCHTYIPLIVLAFWGDYMLPIPPIKGTRNSIEMGSLLFPCFLPLEPTLQWKFQHFRQSSRELLRNQQLAPENRSSIPFYIPHTIHVCVVYLPRFACFLW